MKKTIFGALAATAALGVTMSMIPAGAATAAVAPCQQMSGSKIIIGQSTPVCGLVWKDSGQPNIRVPNDTSLIVYGVVYANGVFADRTGKAYKISASESSKWLGVPSGVRAQTIVKGEIKGGQITRTFPYTFVNDDALVDWFADQAFTGRFANSNKSKQVWAKINWSPKGKVDGNITGAIANWDINIKDGSTCREAVNQQYPSDMKKTLGGKKIFLEWQSTQYVGGQSYFVMKTQAGVNFTRNAPSLAKLVNGPTWNPFKDGKWNFTAKNSPTNFSKFNVVDISPRKSTQKCKL